MRRERRGGVGGEDAPALDPAPEVLDGGGVDDDGGDGLAVPRVLEHGAHEEERSAEESSVSLVIKCFIKTSNLTEKPPFFSFFSSSSIILGIKRNNCLILSYFRRIYQWYLVPCISG